MVFRWSLLSSVLLISSLANAWPFFRRRNVVDNAVDSPDNIMDQLKHLEELMFRLPSNATGEKVGAWHNGSQVNPEELGEYAEGDILFPKALSRNGLAAASSRWPGGIVPFMISPYFNAYQKRMIREAMAEFHSYTCIKFKPYAGEESDYIRITAGNTGCWSSVGRVGGVQDMNLQVPGCVEQKGTIIHELMHVVGFIHEQSRYERDNYVQILWNNIESGQSENFNKASRGMTNSFGVGYDYRSVMHYSAYAFTANGQPTILPKRSTSRFQSRDNPGRELGQREGFSKGDIQKINNMYNCGNRRRGWD